MNTPQASPKVRSARTIAIVDLDQVLIETILHTLDHIISQCNEDFCRRGRCFDNRGGATRRRRYPDDTVRDSKYTIGGAHSLLKMND